jgi:hypothetical protein
MGRTLFVKGKQKYPDFSGYLSRFAVSRPEGLDKTNNNDNFIFVNNRNGRGMKILIEVLAESPLTYQNWPNAAKEASGFIHNDACESKIFMILGEDGKSVTASVIQAPIFESLPKLSLLKFKKNRLITMESGSS